MNNPAPKYSNLQELIYKICKTRIYKFTIEEVEKVIKEELNLPEQLMINNFYNLKNLKEILEYLVKEGELTYKNGIYIPMSYQIKKQYHIQNMLLAYSYGLIRGSDHYMDDIEYLYDVETGEEILKKTFLRRIILTGKTIGNGDYEQPLVSLNELNSLYHSFLTQGCSREETILHILNYYKARTLR